MRKWKRFISLTLALVLTLSTFMVQTSPAEAKTLYQSSNYFISESTINLTKGTCAKLAVFNTNKVAKKTVTWSSSNKSIATVNKKNGTVTAVGTAKNKTTGTATITASFKEGKNTIKLSSKVTVYKDFIPVQTVTTTDKRYHLNMYVQYKKYPKLAKNYITKVKIVAKDTKAKDKNNKICTKTNTTTITAGALLKTSDLSKFLNSTLPKKTAKFKVLNKYYTYNAREKFNTYYSSYLLLKKLDAFYAYANNNSAKAYELYSDDFMNEVYNNAFDAYKKLASSVKSIPLKATVFNLLKSSNSMRKNIAYMNNYITEELEHIGSVTDASLYFNTKKPNKPSKFETVNLSNRLQDFCYIMIYGK